MGIQGLLPLLKSIQQPICISELAGSTIGVDVYCWLHKGAYGCALELAEGNDSNLYVCFALINMWLITVSTSWTAMRPHDSCIM